MNAKNGRGRMTETEIETHRVTDQTLAGPAVALYMARQGMINDGIA